MESIKGTVSKLLSGASTTQSTNSKAEYLRAARRLLGCYRTGDANDPEVYIAGVVAVLAEYPLDLVDYVCDPRTGLPARFKWLPTIAEVKEVLEAEAGYRQKVARYAAMPAPQPQLPKAKVPDKVGTGGPGTIYSNYDEAVKAHGRPFGPFEEGRVLTYGK